MEGVEKGAREHYGIYLSAPWADDQGDIPQRFGGEGGKADCSGQSGAERDRDREKQGDSDRERETEETETDERVG